VSAKHLISIGSKVGTLGLLSFTIVYVNPIISFYTKLIISFAVSNIYKPLNPYGYILKNKQFNFKP
jgi:hypothetical protein